MICTIYSHHTGFEKIKDNVQALFPKGKLYTSKENGSDVLELEIKGGLFKPTCKLRIQYRQKSVPSFKIADNDNSDLTNNLRGLYGFVNMLPSANENVKNLFLQKILTLNCEFSISQEGEIKELKTLLQDLAHEFDAILFVQPGTVVSRSHSQHFLDKNLRLIVDQEGNCEIDTLDVKISAVHFDSDQATLTEDQIERKTRSQKIIEARKIKVNKNLPCIASESETTIRDPKDIAQRVAILAVTNLVAFSNISSEEAIDYLQTYRLWEFVTPDEKEFLANPTEEKKSTESWKCEGIWVLLWALNKVQTLPFPDELCNLGDIPPASYPIAKDKDPNEFIDAVTATRPKAEILDANDLYYRLDWACVDARINGREMSSVHPGVVYERHYALNWLVTYMDQEWDDVSCDT